MPHVVLRQQNIGVAPAVVGVGGSRFTVDIIGFAPRQESFFKADNQSIVGSIGQENYPFYSVVMEIIADVVNRIMV